MEHMRDDPTIRFLMVGETALDVPHFLAGSLFARDQCLPTAASDAVEYDDVMTSWTVRIIPLRAL